MGDIVKGLHGGGTSGSMGAGRGNIKQKNTYIGENAFQKPLEDIMGRLAGEANQQLAQRNLLFGGAGYGGSFESNDQRAARAAGTPLTQKPYGGWGGFGSQNATLGGQEWNGYTPPTSGGPPPAGSTPGPDVTDATGGPPIQIPGTGTPTAPPTNLPPSAGPVPLPAPGAYDKTGGGFNLTGFLDALQKVIGQGATTGPNKAIGAKTGTTASAPPNPNTKEGLAQLMNPQVMAQQQAAYKAELAQNGIKDQTMPWYLNPQLVKMKSDLLAGGMSENAAGPDWASVQSALAHGASVDQIKQHYQALTSQYGPNATSDMHGAAARFRPEDMVSGTATQKTLGGLAYSAGGAPAPGAGGTPKPRIQGGAQQTGKASLASSLFEGIGAPAGSVSDTASTAAQVPGPDVTAFNKGEPETQDPKTWEDYYNEWLAGGGKIPEGFAEWLDGGIDLENPQRPSQFGPQGFNPTLTPKLDAEGNPVLDENGAPIMETIDPSQSTPYAGYAGGDTWSTSALWRPEEPTGGLYGAYTQLASGNLTPYENDVLQGWQQMSKKPNRGEDEAYGAYNDMLKGGYSDSEKNAITQQGMAAARAGFETNRDAMLRNQARTNNSAGYAANMARMARGFSDTVGSQARQNEIDFANETQRRKETGATGMLNVAGLGQTRKTTGLQGQQGAGSYARDLQQKGLQGLHALYTGQDPSKQWATAAGVASNPRETYTESGNASL